MFDQQSPIPPPIQPQQPFVQRSPDSRAYVNPMQSQLNQSHNTNTDICYHSILKLPVYTSSVKTDWFKKGNNNIWYFLRTDINGVSKTTILFQIDITKIQIINPDCFNRFEYLIVDYSSAESPTISTVITFEKFMKKKLQEYFFLPAGFRIPNAKDNVINEFLFYLIINCQKSEFLSTYPYQGWNIDENKKLIFECENRYNEVFKQYLPSSILNRSYFIIYPYGKHYVDKILTILPDFWEIKFLVALRISSLLLKFTYMNQVNPKQLFIIETTNDTNTAFISKILKTNNDYDSELLSLSLSQDKLISSVTDISDGIALIYDYSSSKSNKHSSVSLSFLSDYIMQNAHNPNSSKQIISIISPFAQYNIDPEKYYIINFDGFYLNYEFSEVTPLLQELDNLIIFYFYGKSYDDIIKEYATILTMQRSIVPTNLPSEIQDTYLMINCAISFFNNNICQHLLYGIDLLYLEYFKKDDIVKINNFLINIDRTGHYPIARIIDSFVNQLNTSFSRHFKCIPLSDYIIDDVTDEIILTDSENIYISPAAFDSIIIPNMDVHINHRPLIKTLFENKILTSDYHYCCRLHYTDSSLYSHQIYRYRINRNILSSDNQRAINKATNSEFFHKLTTFKHNSFIPFITDENSDTWAGRLIENGAKANNHMLITGESGSGKSYMMIRTAAYLAEFGERVIILDSSGSNTFEELKGALSEEFVNNNIEIYNLDNQDFPIDPFSLVGLKRKDSKANHIYNILRSALYDASDAQNDKLKTLIFENIDSMITDERISPENIQKILIKDGSTISALRDKLLPLLFALEKHINYEKTWADYLASPKKILIFSMDTSFEKQGKKLLDILLASLYFYHIKHKYTNIWLCIDEIYDQNLKEDGAINMIFTQGRKSRINIIGATQGFQLSRSDEWTTLNNAKTKIFFKPLSTSISDVMKELNIPQSQRSIFANMQQRECIISSELYSKKEKNNIPAIVRGMVPKKFASLRDVIPPSIDVTCFDIVLP